MTETIMMDTVTFGKIMNGYEFVEFMRKFGWRHHRKILKFKDDDCFDGYTVSKRKFKGWEYWFDSPKYLDILDESTLIIYEVSAKEIVFKNTIYVLEKYGFKRIGG